jgi:hypothetical protein
MKYQIEKDKSSFFELFIPIFIKRYIKSIILKLLLIKLQFFYCPFNNILIHYIK